MSGPLDYVTSRAAGKGDMGKLCAWRRNRHVTETLMIRQDGLMVFLEKPYVVLVAAKRTEALERQDSQAQLCAQIRSLQIQWLMF